MSKVFTLIEVGPICQTDLEYSSRLLGAMGDANSKGGDIKNANVMYKQDVLCSVSLNDENNNNASTLKVNEEKGIVKSDLTFLKEKVVDWCIKWMHCNHSPQ